MAKINRRELLNELKKVAPVVGKNSTLEILKGMLIEVKNNTMQISGSNLETSVVTSLDYNGSLLPEEFTFIIEGKLFLDIISKNTSDEVEITFAGGNISISSGGSNFNLKEYGEVQSFPNIESNISDNTITIKSSVFKDIIAKTVGFITEDDSRPVLSGVKLEFRENKITGVSLDGYRLGHVYQEVENETEIDFLIPGHSLLNVSKALDKETMIIKYSENSDLVGFVIGNTTVYTKQLAGQFFDYKSILKYNDCTTIAKVNLQNITEAIDRVSIMARNSGKFNPITINISENEFTITNKSEIGNVIEKVEVEELEGKGLDISFNPQYLLEGLKACKAEIIEMRFSSSLNPGYIIENDTNFVYLALPIRLSNAEAA